MRPFVVIFLVLLLSCDTGEETQTPIESAQFAVCNQQLSPCASGSGEYCLFGYKWGAGNPFIPTGFDVAGPEEPVRDITYSFQNAGQTLVTHRQVNVPSQSFDTLLDCARTQIRRAMDAWSQAADISFVEMPENSPSDIRFFATDIFQSGIGYPNYTDLTCSRLKGNVFIKPNSRLNTCDLFYNFVLHEIGHTLGLGHVDTDNIMNPDRLEMLDGLQAGDKQGVVEIYGERLPLN